MKRRLGLGSGVLGLGPRGLHYETETNHATTYAGQQRAVCGAASSPTLTPTSAGPDAHCPSQALRAQLEPVPALAPHLLTRAWVCGAAVGAVAVHEGAALRPNSRGLRLSSGRQHGIQMQIRMHSEACAALDTRPTRHHCGSGRVTRHWMNKVTVGHLRGVAVTVQSEVRGPACKPPTLLIYRAPAFKLPLVYDLQIKQAASSSSC
eukprot:1851472-Rhodomonas_salina.4